MSPPHKYIPEIDLLKFVFAVAIVGHHAAKTFHSPYFAKGYLAVEFFFLVSGFFMSRTLRSDRTPGEGRFLFRKAASIYPVLFVSTALAFAVRMILVRATPARLLSSLANAVWEFLLVREIGLRIGPEYNAPVWYVSSMLIAMGVLYPLFRRLRGNGLIPVAALLCSLGCYAALWHACGSLVAGDRWTGFVTWRTIRAVAGLSCGVFLGEMAATVQKSSILPTIQGHSLFVAVSAIFLSVLTALLAAPATAILPGSADFLVVPVLSILLFSVFTGWGTIRLANPECLRPLGTASLYVYVNHAAVLAVLGRIHGLSATKGVVLLLIGTALLSLMCALAVRLLRTAFQHLVPAFIEVKHD